MAKLSRLGAAFTLVSSLALLSSPSFAQFASDGLTVGQIRVEGAQRIDPATVRSYLGLRPGQPLTQEALDQAVRNLFATGLFADVTLRREGGALVVEVEENPIVNRIAFEGNRKLDDEKLEAEIETRPRSVFTRARVQNDVQRVLELYRRNERFAAVVEPKIIPLDQNRVDLVFEVDEGPTTKVRRISFVGNERFDDSDLRDVISTEESAWYRFFSTADSYDPDRLAFDRELLRRFYLSEGYADFRVVSDVAELSPDRTDFFITFTVEEGERYKFGDVEIASSLPTVDVEALKPELTMSPGDWYDATEVEDNIADLTAALDAQGIPFFEIQPRLQRNRDEKTIDVTFEIAEGPRIYVERIDIVGNLRTMDPVIRREMLLVEGDPLNLSKLQRSEQRIRDLGFFSRVSVTRREGTQPDRAVIVVDVEEQSTGELTIGAGFSTVDGLLGDVSLRERNLLGRGQDLRLSASLSSRRTQFDLSFTEPYFLERDLSAGVDLFHVSRDNTDVSGFDSQSTGFGLRLAYPLGERLRQSIRYTLDRTKIDVKSTAAKSIRQQEGTAITSEIGQELIYDVRDSRLSPTEGYFVRYSTDFAGLGGDVQYIRNRLGGGVYFPLYERWVLSVTGELGHIASWGNDDRVRIVDRFFLGGESLRGFANGSVGPRDGAEYIGGNVLARGSVEMGFPLPLPEEIGLRGYVFSDFGTLGHVDEPNIKDDLSLRATAGVGVGWRSPLGPIRFNLAYPIRKEPTDDEQRFSFSFGTRF